MTYRRHTYSILYTDFLEVNMNIDKIEACLIYFPRAQYLLSLQNEDKELIEQIFKLVKNNPKLIDLHMVRCNEKAY